MRSGRLYLGRTERMWFGVIKRIWRLLAAMTVIGILGGVFGLLIDPFYDAWHNSWIAAGLTGPAGFLVGLLWQISDRQRRRQTPLLAVLFLGFLAVVMAPLGAFDEIRWQVDFEKRLNALTSLSDHSVEKATFCDKYGRQELLEIADEVILAEFALACRDAEGYSPNHPRYKPSWYVVLEGPQRMELMCHYEDRWPDKVVGYFVAKRGNTTRYYGSFISKDLRPWFDTYVESVAGDDNG